MTAGRLYCIQSWNNASETSGEQIGNRLAQSRGLHFDRNGNANTALYAEETVEKKTTKVPLKNRILPQAARVEKLTAQMVELVQEYKQGLHTKEDYSLLLSVISAKRARAEELLAKAISVKAPFEQEEAVEAQDDAQHSPQVNSPTHSEKPVQIAVNHVNKGSNSAKVDLIKFVTGSLVCFVAVMFMKTFM